MEVTAMRSSEGEEVGLEFLIDTAAARGQVEKWLLQLEDDMKKSVRAMVTITATYMRRRFNQKQ